jgi:hypothetical protein
MLAFTSPGDFGSSSIEISESEAVAGSGDQAAPPLLH